jgi:PAS domain S-box-containing protein
MSSANPARARHHGGARRIERARDAADGAGLAAPFRAMPAGRSTVLSAFSHFSAEAALHALTDAVCVVDADWRIVFVNRAFERTLGVEETVYLGRDVREAFPDRSGRAGAELIRATMADGATRTQRLAYHDARVAGIFDVTVCPMPGGGVAVQFHDVSRSSRVEHELLERSRETESLREMTRALLEQEDLPALLELLCREAMAHCDATGATVVEVVGDRATVVAAIGLAAPIRDRQFAVAGSLTERAIAACAPVSSGSYAQDFPAQAEDLGTRSVGPVLLAPLVAHGDVLGVLGVSREAQSPVFGAREERWLRAIANHAALAVWKQRLIQDAQEASRAKTEFIATISHEFRTPLAAVAGYEELLADDILGPVTDKQRAALERMRASIQHLSAILEEILTFSRLEAGEEEVKIQRATIQEALMATAAVLEPLAREKGLELAVSVPRSPTEMLTDVTMVRRILVNLGGNAVKFTERGTVELEAVPRGDEVSFHVRDTGIGIAADDLRRLFVPFSQLETGFTRRFSGAGLGLFVSQRLAHLLHGRIEVESTPGKGSAFTLLVPRRWRKREPAGR